ncbi:hypothetical protein WJX73_003266 [Symbiochloris irregularis]|uniref:Uncharacterized protein n=1 Tax=Symbiochloris irregularis TaxID=706552 RepID=A0AAW1NSU2_9CHLO
MCSALEPDEAFDVTFAGVTRQVKRSQLAAAPESLLSKLFLDPSAAVHVRAVVIPSQGTAPGLAAWQDGDAQLFEVCIDCYTGPSQTRSKANSETPSIPAVRLQSGIVGYFDIPRSLWPAGYRIAMKALERRADLDKIAWELMAKAAEIMEQNLQSTEELVDQEINAKMEFGCARRRIVSGNSQKTQLTMHRHLQI